MLSLKMKAEIQLDYFTARSPEEGIPFKQKASFRWEMVQPKTRQRRDVLFTFEDLLGCFFSALLDPHGGISI